MKVQTLTVLPVLTGFASTTEGLSNVAIFVNDGTGYVQTGSGRNYLAVANGNIATAFAGVAAPTFGTTNLFTIGAGKTVTIEIRGDLTQNATSYIATADANLKILANAVQGSASAQTWPTTANGDQTYTGQNALSIVTGSLTVSKSSNFASQNVLANTQKVKIGSFTLQSGNAEDVNVTSLSVAMGGTVNTNDLTGLYIVYAGTTADPVVPSAANNFTANFTVPANDYRTVEVYTDLGSNIANGTTSITSLTVNYRGAKTNTTQATTVTGQTMTIAQGSLSAPTIVSSEATTKLVAGGTTGTIASYKFVSTNGVSTINELWFNIFGGANGDTATTTANGAAISSVTVGGKTATVVFNGSNYVAKVTGLSIAVPAGNTGINIPVSVAYNTVTATDQGGAPTRLAVGVNLVYYKYQISNTVSEPTTNVASNVMYLVGSVPTVDKAADSPTGQSTGFNGNGATDMLHFTVTAPANQPINLKAVGLTPNFSAGIAASNLIKIYASDDLSTVLGSVAIGTSGAATTTVFTNDYAIAAGTTKTFYVYADTRGTYGSSGLSVSIDLTATNDTGVSTGSDWKWNDTTVNTYGNGFLLKNLPKTGGVFAK